MGPVSMAVLCPGTDYDKTIEIITWYRFCSEDAKLIERFVTFHLFFDTEHMPDRIFSQWELKDYQEHFRVLLQSSMG